MKYSEYSTYDIGSGDDLFAPSAATTEESIWDKHVEANASGFSRRTWLMLIRFALVIFMILTFSWWCSDSANQPDEGEPGIVSILKTKPR